MFQRAALPIASTATGSAHTESFRSFPLRRSALVGLAGCAILVLCATAQAQVVRFVSSGGNDANNCMRATPCLTLQRGIDRTPPNGELQILDSGNYADTPATISRSIAISADGVTANVGGIIVNGVGIVVALRGLHLAGRGLADTSGVAIGNAAATVSIERCTIEQFRAHGVQVTREDTPSTSVVVTDSIIRDNVQDGLTTLGRIRPTGATISLAVTASRFENNGQNGLLTFGTSGSITDTVISGHGRSGISQQGGKLDLVRTIASGNDKGYVVGDAGLMMLESSVARDNATIGLRTNANGTASIANSVLTNNAIGISNGGIVATRQNNLVDGNTNDLAGGALTVLGGQ